MRVAVIGGTGHIGTYLTPRLVEEGHSVTCVSRGESDPYRPHDAWQHVAHVLLDRKAEESHGTFGERIAALDCDAVIDLTCYLPESSNQLVEALRGQVRHFLHCGTIWVYGSSIEVPSTEEAPRRPFGDYSVRKAAIEESLLRAARAGEFPATILHPGHLVGPGWTPINPTANFSHEIFERLASGKEVAVPNLGMETVHHVHAADVAEAFVLALAHPDSSIGESFNIVSARAVTLRGYAERMATWYGQEPRLRFLPWEEWKQGVTERAAAITWDHISRSPNCSIAKARERLGYTPRYTSLEAVQEVVTV